MGRSAASLTWIKPRRITWILAVRTGVRSDMQLKCDTGVYELSMLVRGTDDPELMVLSGRVVGPEKEPARGVTIAPVDDAGFGVGVGASTDEFGEFGMKVEADTCHGLRLGDAACVSIRDGD